MPARRLPPLFACAGLLFAALGAGCATPPRPPADLAAVRLEPGHSPQVRVGQAWLERADGRTLLRGYVLRSPAATAGASGYLEIALLDSAGREVRTVSATFEPRQLRRRVRLPAVGRFVVPLDPLPPDLACVAIRVRDQPTR